MGRCGGPKEPSQPSKDVHGSWAADDSCCHTGVDTALVVMRCRPVATKSTVESAADAPDPRLRTDLFNRVCLRLG